MLRRIIVALIFCITWSSARPELMTSNCCVAEAEASSVLSSGGNLTVPADTSEDTLVTANIAANALGLGGCIRVTTVWSYTNSANNKTLRVRFSGASGTTYFAGVFTTTVGTYNMTFFCNQGAAAAQGGNGTGSLLGNTTTQTSSVDTTAATTVVITGQKASSGETITLLAYNVIMER
jgi:hypothetical protein